MGREEEMKPQQGDSQRGRLREGQVVPRVLLPELVFRGLGGGVPGGGSSMSDRGVNLHLFLWVCVGGYTRLV